MVPLAFAAILVLALIVIALAVFASWAGPAMLALGVSAFAPCRGVSGPGPRAPLRDDPQTREALTRFYAQNATADLAATATEGLPPGDLLLFFNVHCFISLSARDPETRERVRDLLKSVSARTDIIAFAEVEGDTSRVLPEEYRYIAVAPNGAQDHSSSLLVASRSPLEDVLVIDTSVGSSGRARGRVEPVDRSQILFRTPSGARGAIVHLEIGQRLVAGDNLANAGRRQLNSSLRIGQLEKILEHEVDFIAGDFNFTLSDPEAEFLRGRGFVPTHGGEENSTPYNRVDHCFVRQDILGRLPEKSNKLIHCNMSDHLPMAQTLPEGRARGG